MPDSDRMILDAAFVSVCVFVNSASGQRVVYVSNCDDPCRQRNCLSGKLGWIARTVPTFVMEDGDFVGECQEVRIAKALLYLQQASSTDPSMCLHAASFVVDQPAGFPQD